MRAVETPSRAEALNESSAKEVHRLDWLSSFGFLLTEEEEEALARTHFEEGFMALNRAIGGGGRTKR